jgi:hypothetical protein
VSVTPKIVNWGVYGEGGGQAAIVNSEITSWNRLAEWMLDTSQFDLMDDLTADANTLKPKNLKPYTLNDLPVPFELKSRMLKQMNKFSPARMCPNRS